MFVSTGIPDCETEGLWVRVVSRGLAGYQIDHDFHALAEAVACTYATDPNYARLVVNIASQPNIVRAIGFGRQEAAANSTGDAD